MYWDVLLGLFTICTNAKSTRACVPSDIRNLLGAVEVKPAEGSLEGTQLRQENVGEGVNAGKIEPSDTGSVIN